MKKIVLLAFVLAVLSTAMIVGFVRPVVAEETIYIKLDGSVEGTDKIQREGNIYTFTDNIVNQSIVVERDNIVVDGAGYTLQGTGSGTGVDLSWRNNVTIKNVEIKAFYIGIDVYHSSGNCIFQNNITANSGYGILLSYYCYNNTISGNNVSNNNYGIYIYTECSNNTVSDNDVSNNNDAIWLYIYCNNNTVYGNNASSNNWGISVVFHSNNNSISGNDITNNTYGIVIYESLNNSVYGNDITNNRYGVTLTDSSNNTIFGNNIGWCSHEWARGIGLFSSSDNIIFENTIIANNKSGIYLSTSSNNKFYHNNLINNTQQVYDYSWDYPEYSPSVNTWDDGYPSGGNYWSNYTGVDANMDGIGDSSYEIDSNNIDHYPLMGMFSDFPVTLEEETYHVTTVCNSTISAFQFDQVNKIIRFNVTGEEGIGFCRVCIPHALMEPPYTITVDGHPPQYINYTLYDNGTHRWIYFTYLHSTYEVEIIPEFPAWTSILLILIVLTVAIVIYKRRLPKTPTH